MPRLRTVGFIIGIAALSVLVSASPAAAHAGDDMPDIDQVDLTAGPFDVTLSLEDEENRFFLVQVFLTSESGARVSGAMRAPGSLRLRGVLAGCRG